MPKSGETELPGVLTESLSTGYRGVNSKKKFSFRVSFIERRSEEKVATLDTVQK